MPTYSYQCTECDNRFDIVQAFTDDALTKCERCAGRLRKLFGSVGVVFKGSGFYRTDSRESSKSSGNGSSKSESGSGSGSSEQSGSSDKSASTEKSSGSSEKSGSGEKSSASSSTSSASTAAATS